MNFRAGVLLCATLIGAIAAPPISAAAERTPSADAGGTKTAAEAEGGSPRHLSDALTVTQGSVTIAGQSLGYRVEAGWPCRPTRPLRGTTTSCPVNPTRSSRCCATSRISP